MTKPIRFDISDLRLVLAIADAGTLSAASEALPLALSAASSRLRLLENRLGVKLFERDTFGMTLTVAGREMVSRARRIERAAQDAQAAMKGLSGQRRHMLSIAANFTAISTVLPDLVSRFLAERPYLDITLMELPSADVVKAVDRRDVDLGVIDEDHRQADLVTLPMGHYRLAVVTPANHPLAQSGNCSFRALTEYPLIGFPTGSGMQRFLERMARLTAVDLHIRAQAPTLSAITRLVAGNIGVAIIPEAADNSYRKSMDLALLHLTDDWAERQLMLCSRPWDGLSTTARAMARVLSGIN